ncbi:GYD domain-containing protein [Candidatus Aerophobetes bacterium]|nr:GYD domain-containing protein [Candidatus Aerophobetes bacterium]
MATYIILANYTAQGIKNIKESSRRVEAARKTFKDMGVEMKSFYSAMGRYDTVVIVEAPDDETMAKALFAIGSLGNIRSETLRVFPEDEFRKIVAKIP